MREYKTVRPAEAEIVVRRSKFIAYAMPVADEAALRAALCEIRKRHKFATHVCYGAVLSPGGTSIRFSDDGEPSGTAGQPIAAAVKNHEVCETLVAVVRYFGGVKLGTGGLVRAYTDAAAAVLDRAPVVTRRLCALFEVTIDLSTAAKMLNVLRSRFIVISVRYGEAVVVTAAAGERENVEQAVAGLTGGKCTIRMVDEAYIDVE